MFSKAAKLRYDSKWSKCEVCPLHKHAKTHVLYRGVVPADLFFLGEAPGKIENKLGIPFVGPSGDVLSATLAILSLNSYVIANTVCCIPWEVLPGEDHDGKIRAPLPDEVEKCLPHVKELITLARPKLIVSLGEVAKKHLAMISSQERYDAPTLHLRHPAYVLRNGGKGSFEHKQMILTLQRACVEHEIEHYPHFKPEQYAKEVTTNNG